MIWFWGLQLNSNEKSYFISMPFLSTYIDARTLNFFPPAESWLVNSNFPRASRMQGSGTSHIIRKRKGKPWIDFPVVSGFAGGRVRSMRWWSRCKMAAMLQLIGWQSMQPWFIAFFFDSEYPFYGQLTPVKSRGDLYTNLSIFALNRIFFSASQNGTVKQNNLSDFNFSIM